MDVLFVNAQDALELRKEVNGQLILGTLLLQADFDVDVLRFCQVDGFKGDYEIFIQNMINKILSFEPRAVSFYSLWPDYHIMLRIAKELKAIRPEIYTVFGGPQPSATAQDTMEAMPYVDFICSSEGENTVVPFFTALLRNKGDGLGSVPGLFYRVNGLIMNHNLDHPLCDLNTLPHWDDRLYLKHYQDNHENYQSKKYYMPIDAGRGCPYSCTFCCTSGFWRRTYRLKSPERIVKDIEYYNKKFGITSFWFSHDAFTSNVHLVEEVCNYILGKSLKITWKCTARIDCINERLIQKMQHSGLIQIELGVETGSQRMQKLIHKNLDISLISKKVEKLISFGIQVDLFFMYGFPEETEADLLETTNLLSKLLDAGVHHATMSFCKFSPQTEITNKYINQLRWDENSKLQARDIWGFHNEKSIKIYREIFPFYYHLDTTVRNKYHYLVYLIYLYEQYPLTFYYIRSAIPNINLLNFYDSLYIKNKQLFKSNEIVSSSKFIDKSVEIISKALSNYTSPYISQVLEILKFENDMHTVKQGSQSLIRSKYGFNYSEVLNKTPIELLSNQISDILLYLIDNTLKIQLMETA